MPTPKKETEYKSGAPTFQAATEAISNTLTSDLIDDIDPNLDPHLQSIVLALRHQQSLSPSLAFTDNNGNLRVEVLAKLRDPTSPPPGLHISSAVGMIAAGSVDVTLLEEVRRDPNVISLKAATHVRPQLRFSVPEIRAGGDRFSAQFSNGTSAVTGAGVVVGIVDFGCDFAHDNFRNPDGSTRLLALWDQTGDTTSASPQPFDYGREFSRDQINDALRRSNPYSALAYAPEDESHGTHVMDIAAGNGRIGGPGVAPKADLIFVELGTNDVEDTESLGNSKRLFQAVQYIFKQAGDRPCVVNLSLGTHGGPHDGSTLAEQGFDELLKVPGRSIVVAAGNSYEQRGHSSGSLAPGAMASLRWMIPAGDTTANELEIWYPGEGRLEVNLIAPNGTVIGPLARGQSRILRQSGLPKGRIIHRHDDPNNHANHVDFLLDPSLPSGQWRIELKNVGASALDWHAWIERDDDLSVFNRRQSRFHEDDATPSHTIGSISCGQHTIAVGAYTALTTEREIAPFSSAGPTRDGRNKPEIGAPGQSIIAARATRNSTTQMSGTSMAAPHITGVVALLMEAADRNNKVLSSPAIQELLRNFSRRSENGGSFWDPRLGYGRADALQCLISLLPASPIHSPVPNASSSVIAEAKSQDFLEAFLAALSNAAISKQARIRVAIETEPAGLAAK